MAICFGFDICRINGKNLGRNEDLWLLGLPSVVSNGGFQVANFNHMWCNIK